METATAYRDPRGARSGPQRIRMLLDLPLAVGGTGQLSDSVDALDAKVTVLAEAIEPLQRTSERIGRLVDRLPDRRGGGRTG